MSSDQAAANPGQPGNSASVIDFHVHIFPDHLAAGAIARLEQMGMLQAHFDGTLSGLQASMQQAGIAVSVIQPVSTKPTQVQTINQWVVELNQRPEIRAFGTLHPEMTADGWAEAIAFLKARGIRGVKMHPEYQNFHPDEDRLADLYSALAAADMVLLLHAGHDLAFKPPFKATPRRLLQIHQAYPRLKLVLAHLGGYDDWENVGKYLVGQDLWLDTAFCFEMKKASAAVEILRAHPAERLLFASDGPWGDQARHLQSLRKTNLIQERLAMIEGKNAKQLLEI